MDVRQFAEQYDNPKVPNRTCFRVLDVDLYPKMIEEILDIIKDGGEEARAKVRGDRLDKTAIFGQYLPRALRVPHVAWELALQEPSDDMTEESLAARAEALEVASRWFMELLHVSIHHAPMHLRVMKSPGNPYRPKP